MTREEYLRAMATELNTRVFAPACYPLQMDKIAISCGFPSRKATASRNRTIGQCFSDVINGKNEIFIHPQLATVTNVGETLAHELVHAYDNCVNGHRAPFRRIAVAIGLTGKMTSTVAGEGLQTTLDEIREVIGDYPHEALNYTPKKKQSTRLIKAVCYSHDYIVRMSRKTIAEHGAPICPTCFFNGSPEILDIE